jgi:hypothetical protein
MPFNKIIRAMICVIFMYSFTSNAAVFDACLSHNNSILDTLLFSDNNNDRRIYVKENDEGDKNIFGTESDSLIIDSIRIIPVNQIDSPVIVAFRHFKTLLTSESIILRSNYNDYGTDFYPLISFRHGEHYFTDFRIEPISESGLVSPGNTGSIKLGDSLHAKIIFYFSMIDETVQLNFSGADTIFLRGIRDGGLTVKTRLTSKVQPQHSGSYTRQPSLFTIQGRAVLSGVIPSQLLIVKKNDLARGKNTILRVNSK